MPTCNLSPVKYELGQKSALGNNFSFSNNFAYDNLSKEISVGTADPVTGAITKPNCTISISNSRLKIEISKINNANGTSNFFFEFIPVLNDVDTNLFCSLADIGMPIFTIEYNTTNNILAFIGTDDVRTGRAILQIPIDPDYLPKGVFLKHDAATSSLFIKV